MYRQKQMHEFAVRELARCKTLYADMGKRVKRLPEGTLALRDGELCRAVRENGRQYLVPLRGDKELHRALKSRRYIKKALPLLKHKIEVLTEFIVNDVMYDPKLIEKELPVQYNGIWGMTLFLDGDVDVEAWMHEEYQRNPAPFMEEHYTKRGIRTRSKSEAMIGSRLEDKGIIYRAEPRMVICGKVIYPDFVILLPEIRTIVIWEHFGKIDDKDYVSDKFERVMDYGRSGFYPGVNLFLTSEMRGKPLTIPYIDKVIEEILKIAKKAS